MTIFEEYLQVSKELVRVSETEQELLQQHQNLLNNLRGRVNVELVREIDTNKREHSDLVRNETQLEERKEELRSAIHSFFEENEEVKEVAIPVKDGGFTVISMRGGYVEVAYSER